MPQLGLSSRHAAERWLAKRQQTHIHLNQGCPLEIFFPMTGLKLTGLFTGEEQRSVNTSNHFIREVVNDSKDEGPIPWSPNQGREGQILKKSL